MIYFEILVPKSAKNLSLFYFAEKVKLNYGNKSTNLLKVGVLSFRIGANISSCWV